MQQIKLNVVLMRVRRRLEGKGQNVKLYEGVYHLTDKHARSVKALPDFQQFCRDLGALQPFEEIRHEDSKAN